MTNYLSSDEHSRLHDEISSGDVQMVVTRNLARQFFLRVGRKDVHNVTGQSIVWQKISVLLSLGASIIVIIACLTGIMVEFGWLALLFLPLTGIFWTILAGFTTELGGIVATLLIYIFAMAVAVVAGPPFLLPLGLFATSITLFRVAHFLAQTFLVKLLVTSFDAYEMLAEHIVIVRSSTDAA